MIILDLGSGNTCCNDIGYACRMIREIFDSVGSKGIIIKWQLFKQVGKNTPLSLEVFERAYYYAQSLGFQTTASVFDIESLSYLLTFNVPFIKISNNFAPTELMEELLKDHKIVRSGTDLCCISKYPATKEDYENTFKSAQLKKGISDHTSNFDLYKKYRPEIYECHVKLDDSIGLDAGSFARLPKQLKELFK